MKFILSSIDDRLTRTRLWIVGRGLGFWFVSRIGAAALLMACIAVYNRMGVHPEALTDFAGDPERASRMFTGVYGFALMALVAPICEECIFRLWLSFRKWHVALAVAMVPLYLLAQQAMRISLTGAVVYAAAGAALFCALFFLTRQEMWTKVRDGWFVRAIWGSSIAFGLVHLVAFSTYSLELLPYMLCVVLIPFFAGCAMAYYRVNLGFWWGVGLHIFNNIPAVVMMLFA